MMNKWRSRRISCIVLVLTLFLTGTLGACASGGQTSDTGAAQTTASAEQTTAPAETTTEAATTAAPETTPAETEPETTTTEAETEPAVFTPEADSIFVDLPEVEDGTFLGWRDMGDDSEMIVYQTPDTGIYDAYGENLEQDGFTRVAENEINENLYATLTDGNTDVTLMYVPSQEQTHIVAEPAGILPAPEEENVYEEVCEPLICMVSVNFDHLHDNGLCFIYRLADGSFIVVDGGFNQQGCADSIYETMQKLAPDPDNIVIAAWVITHAHADHIGGFYAFSNTYASSVKLEKIIINFPSDEAFEASDTALSMKEKYKACEALYPDVEVYKTHAGQVFYLRDAVIEMLYSWDLYPIDDRFVFFNNSSLVFSVEIGGQKLMQLGDCGPETSPVIAEMYGDTLDSDFIQVGHHGLQGPNAELNELIAPEIVLWPCSKLHYNRNVDSPRNQMLAQVEDFYIADKEVWMFHLPYSADTVETWDIYDLEE